MLVDVAAVAELEHGVPKIVEASVGAIALVLWRDRVYAIRDICPHMSVSFEGGTVHDLLTGGDSLDEIVVHRGEPVVVCPWHGYQVRLRTGGCIASSTLRSRNYEVTVRDGRVLVDVGPRAKGQDRVIDGAMIEPVPALAVSSELAN
jgi:nitrite reductase/ring-hydroxylating ferredoxin subunit